MAAITNTPLLPVHHCAHCGDEFTTIHPNRRFCSVRCSRAYNAAGGSPHLLTTSASMQNYTVLLIDADMQQLADQCQPRPVLPHKTG